MKTLKEGQLVQLNQINKLKHPRHGFIDVNRSIVHNLLDMSEGELIFAGPKTFNP